MNTQFQKSQYAGFKLDGTLMTRLQFSGIMRIADVSQRYLKRGGELIPYWSIADEYGAKLSCWNEELVKRIVTMEIYEVRGDVKIGKGGTFLNLKTLTVFSGNDYHENTDSIDSKTIARSTTDAD